jgi:hypothetical protein
MMNAMSSDPRLAALPALRKRAEEEARERVVTFAELEGADCAPDGDVATVAAVELALLADLTRSASRWELAALIGARLGREPVDVLQAIQNGGWGWIELCKDAHVDAAELECGADDEAITALALVVLGGAS